jgi:hypothetical protein
MRSRFNLPTLAKNEGWGKMASMNAHAGRIDGPMVEIRKAIAGDEGAVWQIIRSVLARGDTYVFPPDSTEKEMIAYWFSLEKHNYVAILYGTVVGTFWLKPNYPGLASHIVNAAYMVAPDVMGKASGGRWANSLSTRRGG